MIPVRLIQTPQLRDDERKAIRRLMDAAFGGAFTDDDWAHALGGWHACIGERDLIIAHASVVERHLLAGDRGWRTGYVEAVAVTPDRQGTGLGTAVMAPLTDLVRERFELGALSTHAWHFYERLGWQRWAGPTFVRTADGGWVRTPDEDDGVMVLRCAATAALDLAAPITCDERAGDSW